MPLFVSVFGALYRGSFLLRNQQITRGNAGKSIAYATIRKPGIQERPQNITGTGRTKKAEALAQTS
jgi:hypothetical protein